MTNPIEPVLHPVRIADLLPTQFTVGMREVMRKRASWRARCAHGGGEWLGAHLVPVVHGPGDHFWIVDHHHLALALHLEGVEHVLVSVMAHLHDLPKKRFLAFLDARNWIHPYDADGKRQDVKDLPHHVGKLADDPYRSLAGELRRAGGYAKVDAPYTEFLWADFLRDRIAAKMVADKFDKALDKALTLARSEAAKYLPGYAGPEHDPHD